MSALGGLRKLWDEDPFFAMCFLAGCAMAIVMLTAPIIVLGVPELIRWIRG